ncbi:hypothetical protein LINPERHAP1_LOCUS17374 [Linum perenne]
MTLVSAKVVLKIYLSRISTRVLITDERCRAVIKYYQAKKLSRSYSTGLLYLLTSNMLALKFTEKHVARGVSSTTSILKSKDKLK